MLAMFYATCTAICPRIAAEMLRLERSLSASQRAKTRFVMISFDHERDNSAALQKFVSKMKLTDSFTLLSGQTRHHTRSCRGPRHQLQKNRRCVKARRISIFALVNVYPALAQR